MKGPEVQFLDHLRTGHFMLQKVTATGTHVFYPRYLGEISWDWVEATGRATVYSRTIIRRKPDRGGDYCVAVVTLEEGPRMMTRIVDMPPDDVTFGMAVKASVEKPSWSNAEDPVIVFRRAQGATHGA